MELRQLQYLVTVADTGSFSEAAAELDISQPAISQSILKLERELSLTLLNRSRTSSGRATLTPPGEILYDEAKRILAGLSRAVRQARQYNESPAHELRIGFGASIPRTLTRDAMRIVDEMPETVAVPVSTVWGDEHLMLAKGETDLSFLQYPPGTDFDGYEIVRLRRYRRSALFPSTHRLAARASISLADLEHEPILDPGRELGPAIFAEFWLGAPRPYPMPRIVGPVQRSVEEMCAMVANGRGMAIISSALAAHYVEDGLTAVPVDDLEPVEVGLAKLATDGRASVRTAFDRIAELADLDRPAS